MMQKCGCVGLRVNNNAVIKYCPLHAAAPDLLKACQAALRHIGGIPVDRIDYRGADGIIEQLERAIDKASQEEKDGV